MDRAERRRRTRVKVASRVRVLKRAAMLDLPEEQHLKNEKDRQELLRKYESIRAYRIGRCKHMHPFDCGRPRCGVCSRHKRHRISETPQELKAVISQNEWLRELSERRSEAG